MKSAGGDLERAVIPGRSYSCMDQYLPPVLEKIFLRRNARPVFLKRYLFVRGRVLATQTERQANEYE